MNQDIQGFYSSDHKIYEIGRSFFDPMPCLHPVSCIKTLKFYPLISTQVTRKIPQKDPDNRISTTILTRSNRRLPMACIVRYRNEIVRGPAI